MFLFGKRRSFGVSPGFGRSSSLLFLAAQTQFITHTRHKQPLLCFPLCSNKAGYSSAYTHSLPVLIPTMRGCLKYHSPSPGALSPASIATPPPTRGPTPPPLIPPEMPSIAARRYKGTSPTDICITRRCVHFCSEIVDKVFVADEWDRSPAEVTPKLTYQ
ncbi:hypothetical protein BC834DRAFT_347507 [Gloeopeniophorella convolvens]|nr:hypothetical protein BC834DRAFT_347507 [Gloeopeniophorella convolvens]